MVTVKVPLPSWVVIVVCHWPSRSAVACITMSSGCCVVASTKPISATSAETILLVKADTRPGIAGAPEGKEGLVAVPVCVPFVKMTSTACAARASCGPISPRGGAG